MCSRMFMCVLWPSFLMAGLGSAILFAFIDPLDVAIFGYIRLEREFLYAFGFFLLWGVGAGSTALALFLRPDKVDEAESQLGI
jgi:hypothetical protein